MRASSALVLATDFSYELFSWILFIDFIDGVACSWVLAMNFEP